MDRYPPACDELVAAGDELHKQYLPEGAILLMGLSDLG